MNKGDYVEGFEYYGNKTQRMRGWVDKVNSDGSVDIQCDDWYNGARGNVLSPELGEIKVVKEESGWWMDRQHKI